MAMHSLDEQVLERVAEWLSAGRKTWLCTIVATYGSSPRPPGSLFACNARGETAGSLSGGCVEEDLIARLVADGEEVRRTRVVEYGVSAEENERLGLPCGGRLKVLLEPLGESALPHVRQLLDAVRDRRYLRRDVRVATGRFELTVADAYAALRFDGETLSRTFGPRYRMVLVGAGQLSRILAELALAMDYQVVVCDPRRELLDQWTDPGVQLVGGMPDDAVRKYAGDRDSIVLTLTHDPRIDDMALMEALERDLFYVGALGSTRTSAARRKRLSALGVPRARLEKLHAPVGLPIGSKTPMEIAIAILAELIERRARAAKAAT